MCRCWWPGWCCSAPASAIRVVALIVGISQATYSFAPAILGFIREAGSDPAAAAGAAPGLFAAAALVQGLAILAFLAGRRRQDRLQG